MYEDHADEMEEEFTMLWKPVTDCLMTSRQDALVMCQERLSDPISYLPEPITGSIEELRIVGNYLLSLTFYGIYLDPASASYDLQRQEDVLIALREAAEGAIRYPLPDGGRWVVNSIIRDYTSSISRNKTASREDWLNLIELQRQILGLKKEAVQFDNSEEARKEYRSIVLLTTGPLQKLELSYPKEDNDIAYQALDEATKILTEYVDTYGIEECLERPHIQILLSMAIRIEGKGASNEQAATIFSHLRKCKGIMKDLRRRDDSDISTNTAYATIEEFYARALATLAWALRPFKDCINGGFETLGILLEVNEIYRRLSYLPEDLNDKIPPEVNLTHATTYITQLRQLAQCQPSYPSIISTLERALRICFIVTSRSQSQSENANPVVPSYTELIAIDKWVDRGITQFITAILILQKLVVIRGSWGLGTRQEEDGPAPTDTLLLAEKEATLSLEFADKLLSIANTPETKALAEVRRAGILLKLGEVKWFPLDKIPSESIVLWTEARRVLETLEATDGTESDRKEYVRKVLDRLALADKERESMRIGAICEDIEVLWVPIIDLVSEDKLEEAIAACRARIADPLSFFPTPPKATVAELKARGHQQLGMSLYHFMVDKGAPVHTEEIFENLRIAEELFLTHMPWQTAAIAQVLQYRGWTLTHDRRTEESIPVYRAMLEAVQKIYVLPDSPKEKERVKFDKDGRIKLMTALQIRARKLVNLGHINAVDLASEAWQMAQDYFNQYGSDFRYECEKHEILGDLVTATYLAGDLEKAIDFGEQCIEALNEFVETTKQMDNWPNENIQAIELSRALTLSLIAMCASHSSRTTVLGKTTSEIYKEAAELYRRILGLPVDLSQGLDPDLDLNWRYLRRYAANLVPNAVHLSDLEKAMEILALAIKASSATPKPVVYIPYSETLTELDWSRADDYLTSLALRIMQHLSSGHFIWIHDPRTPKAVREEYSIKLSQELVLALRLAEVAVTEATTTKARNDALLDKVESMILQGEVLEKEQDALEKEEKAPEQVDARDNTQENGKKEGIEEREERGLNGAQILAKDIWLEARTLLDSVTDPDKEDGKRKEYFLEKLEGLLKSKNA